MGMLALIKEPQIWVGSRVTSM